MIPSFNCIIFSDMVCSLLSEWCLATSFYQRSANHVFSYTFFNLRNLLYLIRGRRCMRWPITPFVQQSFYNAGKHDAAALAKKTVADNNKGKTIPKGEVSRGREERTNTGRRKEPSEVRGPSGETNGQSGFGSDRIGGRRVATETGNEFRERTENEGLVLKVSKIRCMPIKKRLFS